MTGEIFKKLELKKYIKFLIPVSTIALILIATSNRRKVYPSMAAANDACINASYKIQRTRGEDLKGFARSALAPFCKEEIETRQIILTENRYKLEDLGLYNFENVLKCEERGAKWIASNQGMERKNQSIKYRCYHGTLKSNPGRVQIEKTWKLRTNFKY